MSQGRHIYRSRRRNYHSVGHHQPPQPWISNRLRHHQHHHENHQCYRCGELFNRNHLSYCKARFVRCFACKHFGHFSFVCANVHTYVSQNNAGTSKERNSCKTNNHASHRQTTNRQTGDNNIMIEPVSEATSLAQELPFATINQAALDPEIVSASDREYKLERKLCAVLDRMEEDKILHSMEMLLILGRVTSVKEQLTKCEEEKTNISQEYERVTCRLEETSAENESLKTECNQLREQIKNIRTENSISVNSVSKIENDLQQIRKDLHDAREQLAKSQEENERLTYECEKHERDFSELCHENNFNVTQHNTIVDKLEALMNETTVSVNSVIKSENVKEKWEAESKQIQKKMAQLQDERDYFEERYETYAASNQRAVLQRLELEAEIKKLKKQHRNQNQQQRNQYQHRN